MVHHGVLLPSEGDGRFVRDFIPASHRGLHMLRVFLPLLDDGGEPVRWSAFVPMAEISASSSWWEVVDRVVDDLPEVRSLEPCRGELDRVTARALQDVVGDRYMNSLRWMGYGEAPFTATPEHVYQNEYFSAPLLRDDLRAGVRVPGFVWDDEGTFAWGMRLYPDSLVIACELDEFRELHADPRLDTVSVRADRDVMPPSSGD